jgi:hypothetical protein
MWSRATGLRILLVLALAIIGTSPAYAAPVSNVAGDARITLELLDPTSLALLSVDSGSNPVTISTGACSAGDGVTEPSISTVCPFGGYTFTVGTLTVQVVNKSTTALARMVATPGSTTNDLKFKNFAIRNNLAIPVAVRISGEFNFPDTSGTINGAGRAHGYSCKAQFYNCTSGTCSTNAVGDVAQCDGTFTYFDDNNVDFSSEATGALAGAGVAVTYRVGTTLGGNTMSSRCVAEGSTLTSCPNNPTLLTTCPNNFGTCLAVENLLLRQMYTLNSNTRVEVGAGNTSAAADTCAPINLTQQSEALLEGQCALHANESLNQDSGCVHVEVYGGAVDLSTCDFSTARFGAGGTELGPPQQVNCGQNLDGVGGKNDCFLSFCPSNQNGFSCGDGDVTAQLSVVCDVPVSCQDSVQKGNKIKIVNSTTTTEPTRLFCSMLGEVTPCK